MRPAGPTIAAIVAAVGEQCLREYTNQIFEPGLVALGYYTAENADNWLDIDKFMCWLGQKAQKFIATPPATPIQRPHLSPHTFTSPLPPSSPVPTSLPPVPLPNRSDKGPAAALQSSRTAIAVSDDTDPLPVPLLQSLTKQKRATTVLAQNDSGQFRVLEICDLTKLPSCWIPPRRDDGENFVYRLNLENDPGAWLDDNQQPLSMAAMIKSEDQNAWGGGSSGSTPRSLTALDGVFRRVAKHVCQGIFVCSELDPSLLDGHEQYEPDDDAMCELCEAERVVNVRENSSVAIRAAVFYKEIQLHQCPHREAQGFQCMGVPVYRKLKEINFDGKWGFIGCQNYRYTDPPHSHRFKTIHRDVKEDLLIELFANNGSVLGSFLPGAAVKGIVCAIRSLPPFALRDFLADASSAYTHIDENNKVIQGKIVCRECKATIQISLPLNRSDRWAIGQLAGFHNHPTKLPRKLMRKGKKYKKAIEAAGVTGLTALKCDFATTTAKIFEGKIPGEDEPALLNNQVKHQLIQKAKKAVNPHGMGIEGVLYLQKQMCSTLSHEKQYIWKVTSEHGEEIMITMLPNIAKRIHFTRAIIHMRQCTVSGKNGRLLYTTSNSTFHETEEIFLKMWPGLWELIAHITKTEVKFKYLDGEGPMTILVDGNRPQANVLGVYLVKRNKPEKICGNGQDCSRRGRIWHVSADTHTSKPGQKSRSSSSGAKIPLTRPSEARFKFNPDGLELIFSSSSDWIADKESIPWFFPSFNQFLWQFPENDWYLTPGDTSLNDHTGTNLSILEAIQRAYELDLVVEAKLQSMKDNCVLVNHLNTKPHRDRRNDARKTSNFLKAVVCSEARDELENIEDAIEAETATRKASTAAQKASTAVIKDLQSKKKLLKATSGDEAERRKAKKKYLPHEDELSGIPGVETPLSQPAPALYFADGRDFGANSFDLDPVLEPAGFNRDNDDSLLDFENYYYQIHFTALRGCSSSYNRCN
ncbi:hypothetical protein C8R43DRAFT_946418 [Mycena crocata]|nr:hypothetical protein C8R43DRAFT_946418 [Mycena crocata]